MKSMKIMGLMMAAAVLVTACEDDDKNEVENTYKSESFDESEWYAGGELGTSFNASANAFEQPTPACEEKFSQSFKLGEYLFEKNFNTNTDGAFCGLGPVAVRPGCLYCHPGYGHGKRQTSYSGTQHGNGYLLVIYDKQTENYIYSVAGMPQTLAYGPFKAPIDEKQITIDWLDYTDDWGNTFPDGETYSLIYPEVNIPRSAYYAPLMAMRNGEYVEVGVDEVGVKLESTIGVYGTGLTDAIPDDSITAQWVKEENAYNKGYIKNFRTDWFKDGQWKSYYSNSRQGDGTKYVRRYTYAMSRGPILDAAGANAIWNITNVTRSDRRYHYLDLAGKFYAQQSMADADVQAAFPAWIEQIDPEHNHPTWHTEDVAQNIWNYLTSTELDVEMDDAHYTDFMVWHRGLAVPAARDLDDPDVQLGHDLFRSIGCAQCHRPSWTTGDDHIQDPNNFFTSDDQMPRYPHQKIWPYTDFVQHKLFMVNDIRTGWCRTTPLWGRGLCKLTEGCEDRLHDCRARNTLEAIMWHGAAESDARAAVEKFRELTKEERDAVVKFVDAI
ncbi:MAG: hypothetical protein K6E73_11405 [Bacteroidales bacterium]|nr:hypothetical protein [Bacteroidales bacterium]